MHHAGVMRYRQKPRRVEAICFHDKPGAARDVIAWLERCGASAVQYSANSINIVTADGTTTLRRGDYLVRDRDCFHVRAAPDFERDYEYEG